MTILSFDLETTGTSITKDHIISLSVIKSVLDTNPFPPYNSSLVEVERKNILVKPPKLIPQEATDVHHISNEMVEKCPSFLSYANSLFEYFSQADALHGYNIRKFDIPLLIEEFHRYGLNYNPPKIILDSFVVFTKQEPRNLSAAYKFYTGKVMEGAHDAENDNSATLEILEGQMFMYGLEVNDIAEMCKSDTLDFDGKIIEKDCIPCYNFGKHVGVSVLKERQYAEWMLNGDFSSSTKNVLKSILYPNALQK